MSVNIGQEAAKIKTKQAAWPYAIRFRFVHVYVLRTIATLTFYRHEKYISSLSSFSLISYLKIASRKTMGGVPLMVTIAISNDIIILGILCNPHRIMNFKYQSHRWNFTVWFVFPVSKVLDWFFFQFQYWGSLPRHLFNSASISSRSQDFVESKASLSTYGRSMMA